MSGSAAHEDDPVYFVGSLGGHLELLTRVADELGPIPQVWATSPGVRADQLAQQGHRVLSLPRMDGRTIKVLGLLRGVGLALRERPRVVVTSGAGMAIPFCLTARLLGASLVFVETMARVRHGSRAGRFLRPLTVATIVQWPELIDASYPNAVLCRPALLEPIARSSDERAGTFVTVGSHDQPFGRLLELVAEAGRAGLLPQPIFVQHGVTELPDGVEGSAWISPEEFGQRVRTSAVVISHAGAGALSTAIRAGHRPLVLARRSDLGEHLDDHQDDLVEKLADLGAVRVLGSTLDAADVTAARDAEPAEIATNDLPSVAGYLAETLARLPRGRRWWQRRAA